jgi:hypothetical protein
MNHKLIAGCATAAAFAAAAGLATPAAAATEALSRSVVVKGEPGRVWAKIGGFCAIGEWHPAIASCALDGRSPVTRTLKTRDGQATFVERQVRQAHWSYAYTFTASPLPVSGYLSTFKVAAARRGETRVSWSGSYVPAAGQEEAARAALTGIYDQGLAAIAAKLGS